MNDKLAAKVKATNAANKLALEIYPQLREALAPMLGKRVLKADGALTHAVKKLIPLPDSTKGVTIYRSNSAYTLSWRISVCEVCPGGCVYAEASVHVADLTDGVLTRFYPAPDLRCDYTAEEVDALREKYKAAQKLADGARSALGTFGESER